MAFPELLVFLDSSTKFQISFQDPASALMEGIIDLHHHIFFFLLVIISLVVWLLVIIFVNYYFHNVHLINFIDNSKNKILYTYNKKFLESSKYTHNSLIEIIWTILPALILLLIAIPSFALLYSSDEIMDPVITLKVIGHQWYWSYEIGDYFLYVNDSNNFTYDSYMIQEEDLLFNQLRLLEVDNPLYLPIKTQIRFLITSTDVLHSWAVPSLGIKLDAVPGRLNQCSIFIKRIGSFYGQCSEICGIYHGFMPISIHSMTKNHYYFLIKDYFYTTKAYN